MCFCGLYLCTPPQAAMSALAGVLKYGALVVTGIGTALLWAYVVHACHEGNTWWSEITVPERELTFVSEQAFYLLYFKRAADADTPMADVVHRLLHDDTVEHPAACNALRRFTVYPEVLLGLLWRVVHGAGARLHPYDFYLYAGWAMNGLIPFSVLLLTHLLTGSFLCRSVGWMPGHIPGGGGGG